MQSDEIDCCCDGGFPTVSKRNANYLGSFAMTSGFLTTHVLDTAKGLPAEGIEIALFRVDGDSREKIATAVTNDDGRTDTPILPAGDFATGTYELIFFAGDYLRRTGQAGGEPLFLDQIPIRFGINDAESHYHVPLLLSPYSYSTYRGS
jgi:5-hydroxyisourate hydrolase